MSSSAVGINTPDGSGYKPFKTVKGLMFNFCVMALCFSANHGCVTALIAVGSSLGSVPEKLNGYGNGALYVCYTASALLFANAVVCSLGPKWTMFSGLAAYCVYVASFMIGIHLDKGGTAQTVVVILSGIISGCGAGVLWTGQGKFFASTSEQYAVLAGVELSKATAHLAFIFTLFYLGVEVLMKVLISAVDISSHQALLFTIFTIIAVASCIGMAMIRPVTDPVAFAKANAKQPLTAKLYAAISLCATDPKTLLMAPYNFTFGFAAPFLNQFVNAGITTKYLGNCKNAKCDGTIVRHFPSMNSTAISFGPYSNGLGEEEDQVGCGYCPIPTGNSTSAFTDCTVGGTGMTYCEVERDATYVGWMTAALVVMAVVASAGFGHVVKNDIVPKPVPMVFGSCCFITLGLVFLFKTDDEIAQWDYVIPLYLIFGIGRGVWESTTRSVFADFFPGEKATAGFANIVWQNGLPGAMGFFFFPHMTQEQKALLLVITGCAGIITYMVAHNLNASSKNKYSAVDTTKEDDPLLQEDQAEK